MSELDDFDLAILRLLQRDARLKSEAIAQDVGLSATAVQRRLKRLRDSGVISSEIAIVDPDKVGGRITVMVGVALERGTSNTMGTFRQQVLQEDEVQQCYWVTGEFDFFLIVSTRTMSDYEALTQRLFIDNPGVRVFVTFVTMSSVKRGLQIPL